MLYEDFVSVVVKVIEGVGAGIMVVGGLFALARYAQQVVEHASNSHRGWARTLDARSCSALKC